MIDAKKLIAPCPNINGTAVEALVADLCEACGAVQEAITKVCATAPHGRDFQTLADHQYLLSLATRQHQDRLRRLAEVKQELEAIAQAILK